jgi:hypothetical protein
MIEHITDLDGPSYARKIHGSRYQDAGEPDIDACVMGRAVKVEAKLPGGKPTAIQMARLRRWERAGALAGWATSVAEVDELLSHLGDLTWVNPQLCREIEQHGGPGSCQHCSL